MNLAGNAVSLRSARTCAGSIKSMQVSLAVELLGIGVVGDGVVQGDSAVGLALRVVAVPATLSRYARLEPAQVQILHDRCIM